MGRKLAACDMTVYGATLVAADISSRAHISNHKQDISSDISQKSSRETTVVAYVRSVVALVHCKACGERQRNVTGSEARNLSASLDELGYQDKISYKKHKGCFTNVHLSTVLLSS